MYLIFALISGLIGTAYSVLIRLELSGPGVQFIEDNQLYNSIITSHAIVMIFFMVMPAMIGGFGNFLLPLLVGGPDMAKTKDHLGNEGYKQSRRCVASCSAHKHTNHLGSHLAGLFEGDGHIEIQKNRDAGQKKHNPRFCITFGLKNEPLAKKLLEIIGSGFIRYKYAENACVLTVSPAIGLIKIVSLINGHLRTPKIYKLHELIDWLNQNHSDSLPTKIEKLPINTGSLASDA